MKKSTKIIIFICCIIILLFGGLIGGFVGLIGFRAYQTGKPKAKFKRIFHISPPDYVSEILIEENDSFVDTHSYFKFKCSEENFKKVTDNLRESPFRSGNPVVGLKQVIKEFKLTPSRETRYYTFQSKTNPMITKIGFDKTNNLVFGLAISFWDTIPKRPK
jgi:hypothetical protein